MRMLIPTQMRTTRETTNGDSTICLRPLRTIKRIPEKRDVRLRFRLNQTLRQLLVKPKDPVPMDIQNGVVYRIPCKDCEKMYVGQTDRPLAWRVKEHQR